MARIEWDKTGERFYGMGVDQVVLYPMDKTGAYPKGVAWNGVTQISAKPEGGDPQDLWADNIKYGSILSAEKFGFGIQAYQSPEEFDACDGSATPIPGVVVGQQKRMPFGMSWRSLVGNDTATEEDDGYIIHLVWNATAQPSERSHETVNDSPDAMTFSWECGTVPTNVTGYKPSAVMEIDSTVVSAETMKKVEAKLYGDDTTGTPTLPTPDELITLLKQAA